MKSTQTQETSTPKFDQEKIPVPVEPRRPVGRPKAEHPTKGVFFKLKVSTIAALRRQIAPYRRSAFAEKAISARLRRRDRGKAGR